MAQLPPEMFDLRHIDRYLAEGKVTREQDDAHLASLEDCADDAEPSAVRFIVSERRAAYGSGAPGLEDEG